MRAGVRSLGALCCSLTGGWRFLETYKKLSLGHGCSYKLSDLV